VGLEITFPYEISQSIESIDSIGEENRVKVIIKEMMA
jgi:hypothetical protein